MKGFAREGIFASSFIRYGTKCLHIKTYLKLHAQKNNTSHSYRVADHWAQWVCLRTT